ncbi:protein kinase [Streptomyces sp. NPDC056503]|uniref:serine/threonine-protein kinase n=1 Tax=Streptomyces sp. NPDC056503 TaxID=3345842 RepID=UPI0036B2758F
MGVGIQGLEFPRRTGTAMGSTDGRGEGAQVRAGEVLAGRYQLEARLGRGGMGEVWRGFDAMLQRAVAVKLLLDLPADDHLVARFRREALIGARLQHPGITVVHDAGRHDDRLFMVMELLEGRDLSARMAESPEGLPVREAVRLAIQAAEALDAAHARSVVHRDLKPANLFLLTGGRLKICDFGIASIIDASTVLTRTGWQIGTPPYMAPEQWRGEPVTAQCDLYALGGVLYALLTGTPPFGVGGTPLAMMRRHVEEAPRNVREIRPEVSAGLDALVLRMLAKDARQRPDSAGEVARLLRSAGGGAESQGAAVRPGISADGHVSGGMGEASCRVGQPAAADGVLTLEVRQTVVRLLAEAEQETRAAGPGGMNAPPRYGDLARIAAYVDPLRTARLIRVEEQLMDSLLNTSGGETDLPWLWLVLPGWTGLSRQIYSFAPAYAMRLVGKAVRTLFAADERDRVRELRSILLDIAKVDPEGAVRLTGMLPARDSHRNGALAAGAVTMAERGLGGLHDVLGMIQDPEWVRQVHTWLRAKDARAAPDPGAVMRIVEQPAELRHRAQILSSVAAAWAGDRPQDAAEILVRARRMAGLAIRERVGELREEAAAATERSALVEAARTLNLIERITDRQPGEKVGEPVADQVFSDLDSAEAAVAAGPRPLSLTLAAAQELAGQARGALDAATRAWGLLKAAEGLLGPHAVFLPEAPLVPGALPPPTVPG